MWGPTIPIVVWMMRSFFLEVPGEVLEAASIDGASLLRTMRTVLLPMVAPGIAATALICFIFSWNELLFARVLTATVAETAPVFLTSFVTSQGLFLAQLCAAAFVVSLPVLVAQNCTPHTCEPYPAALCSTALDRDRAADRPVSLPRPRVWYATATQDAVSTRAYPRIGGRPRGPKAEGGWNG